jgi:hypothetical protein
VGQFALALEQFESPPEHHRRESRRHERHRIVPVDERRREWDQECQREVLENAPEQADADSPVDDRLHTNVAVERPLIGFDPV